MIIAISQEVGKVLLILKEKSILTYIVSSFGALSTIFGHDASSQSLTHLKRKEMITNLGKTTILISDK